MLAGVTLPIRPAARTELDAAMAYYEEQRPGLGLGLLDEVESTIALAAENPVAGELRGPPSGAHGTRQFVVNRFPCLVYIAVVGERREVVAIAPAGRRPDYWHDRS